MVHIIPGGIVPTFAFATHLSGWHVRKPAQSSVLVQSSSLKTGAFTAMPGGLTIGTSDDDDDALGETVAEDTTVADGAGAVVGCGVAGEHPINTNTATSASPRILTFDPSTIRPDQRSVII